MDKRCPRCTETLPPSRFGPDPKSRDGLTGWCLKCHRAVVNAGYQKQRQRAIDHLGGRCVQCGYDADARALQLDHINGDGASVRATSWPSQILRSVLNDNGSKYQLLCANCNAIKRVDNKEHGNRVYKRLPSVSDRLNKWCAKCEMVMPASAFHRNAARSDGLAVYCRPCTIAHQAASYLVLRLRVVEHLGGCCKRCKYSANTLALAIDHVKGEGGSDRKAKIVNRAMLHAALTDAADKYQLLCMNCNIIKKIEQREYGARVYSRVIPTERIDRPDQRRSEEWRQHCSEISKQHWANNPEYRERMRQMFSENMKRRWASGEIPSRPKPKLQDS